MHCERTGQASCKQDVHLHEKDMLSIAEGKSCNILVFSPFLQQSFFSCFLSDILGVPSPCAHCGLQWTENETCFSWSLLLLTCYLTPCLTSLKYLVFKMSNLLFLSVHMLCFHLLIIFADCKARENWRNNMLEGLLYIGCCWVFQHINNWLRSLKF